jgi:galactokinase
MMECAALRMTTSVGCARMTAGGWGGRGRAFLLVMYAEDEPLAPLFPKKNGLH